MTPGREGVSALMKKMQGDQVESSTKFGTFGGVFTPTVLTILGVIMYLRLGWVVGNAGLMGAIIIILLAKSVTICTGLSMSSITTNIKIGPGGAYSILSKSLGLEAGGSIGIPLYISQTLSTALYIVGFAEGWLRIFPSHSKIMVLLLTWIAVLGISYISARFAIKIQYVVLVILGVSIVSFLFSPAEPVDKIVLWGDFEEVGFWSVFAVFFPAVTGIMAGANMSGDLKDPKKAIPFGTLTAIGGTLVIYVGLAIVLARVAPMEALRDPANQMIMVDLAWWGPAVLAGILAATFSSALGSMLGAPRILQALAEQKTVPFHQHFADKSKDGEPRKAIIFTGGIILVALLPGNLNALASLITMFFLFTYGMLNLVVFIQQSMKIISFRPTFKIPRIVPFLGAFGCIFMMFLINVAFSLVSIAVIIVLYVYLERKGLESDWGDIRGGMFLVLAERASRIAARFPRHQISWKPDLLIPIEDPHLWGGPLLFIRSIIYPSGSVFALTVKPEETEEAQVALENLMEPLTQQGMLVNPAVIEDNDFLHGAKLVIQTLKSGAFRPNTLFLTLGSDVKKDDTIRALIEHAGRHSMGATVLVQHPRMAFGMQKDVNLWLRDKSPNWHLAMLIALQLQMNWGGIINLVTVAERKKDVQHFKTFLEWISDQARLPASTEFHVLVCDFSTALEKSPKADINIFGLADQASIEFLRTTSDLINGSCLFVKDSGWESALA